MEECLIHGPVIVLAQADDVLHRDGVDSRVKLVRADGLEEVLNSAFDFVILAPEFLGGRLNPVFLHLDEFVKREGG